MRPAGLDEEFPVDESPIQVHRDPIAILRKNVDVPKRLLVHPCRLDFGNQRKFVTRQNPPTGGNPLTAIGVNHAVGGIGDG